MTVRTEASGFTFVTVVHRDDYGLMRLQARSLAKYLGAGLTEDIIVIDNSPAGTSAAWRDGLLRDYGVLADLVRFVEPELVATIAPGISGWFSQQILKLMVSSIVRTERYVILDGKNHLVHSLARPYFETPSGRLRSHVMSYETHPMRSFLTNTLEYFGLDPAEHLCAFTPTTTPFAVPTALARALVAYVEAREQRPFPAAFIYDGYKRSEFFMLAAYQLSLDRSLAEIFDLSGAPSPAIWPESTSEECLQAIATSERTAMPFFATHRRILPKLDADTRREIAAFWCRRGLFASITAAVGFLESPNDEGGSGTLPRGRQPEGLSFP